MAVAAACFRAKLAGEPSPAGERTAGDRGRGQARPFGASDLAAVLATCHCPRRRLAARVSVSLESMRFRLSRACNERSQATGAPHEIRRKDEPVAPTGGPREDRAPFARGAESTTRRAAGFARDGCVVEVYSPGAAVRSLSAEDRRQTPRAVASSRPSAGDAAVQRNKMHTTE